MNKVIKELEKQLQHYTDGLISENEYLVAVQAVSIERILHNIDEAKKTIAFLEG